MPLAGSCIHTLSIYLCNYLNLDCAKDYAKVSLSSVPHQVHKAREFVAIFTAVDKKSFSYVKVNLATLDKMILI